MHRYAAFLSYARRYESWVATLQKNLEKCLEHFQVSPSEVFFDKVDLSVGRSWISQLEEGLESSRHLVLVLTPEALASPRVEDEWHQLVARRPEWKREGRLLPIVLVPAPLPPFLEDVQRLDFSRPENYAAGLRRLVAALRGKRGARRLPPLPDGIVLPEPISGSLTSALRDELIRCLEPMMTKRFSRKALLGLFKLTPDNLLEGYATVASAASALLVHARGEDDELAAARRVVETLIAELDDEPDVIEKLCALRQCLAVVPDDAAREPTLLERYLSQVARDHERLVSVFQQRAELDLLDRVYVSLELAADLEEEVLHEEPRLAGALELRELLALDPATHPWVTRRFVVRGDPGAGKTTLLRHLAASLARDSERAWVPVFESLPRLLGDREFLLDRATRKLKVATGASAEGLASVLEHQAKKGRLLLLLDGLDEVRDRAEAESLLRELDARWPATPIVVATRPIGYRCFDNTFLELDVLPLDRERQHTFLARWLGRARGVDDDAAAALALGRLEADASLQELAGNPLYLTLMALLIERGEELERRRTRLYDQVFQLLLDGGYRPDGKAMDCQAAVRRALRYLAHGMTEENVDTLPLLELEERLYRPEADALRDPLERVPRWRRGIRSFLEELANHTGILGPHDGGDADWRYWHRTFREALAAERLEELYRQDGEASVLAHARGIRGDESRWAEPYALLTGRLEQPDALVRALVEENRALGLRALATAQALADSTLAEILELSEKWQERRKVYEQLGEVVADPERLLPLIDRLRRRTRNGNDLFFLDAAIQKMVQRWPEVLSRAAALRARFYDHIPAPPEELFTTIETPLDGRVELWRTIPEGEFLMGSPPDDERAYSDESPRHAVQIAASFALGTVPVTNAQFRAFDPGHRWRPWKGVSEDELAFHPVVNVTWYQAVSFCCWLSASVPWARGARLPWEEEWEYACRAGTTTRYWSGDEEKDLDQVGWYDANSGDRTHRPGEKPANDKGLYDVHGNVWEWTGSPWSKDYSDRPPEAMVDPRSDPADFAASSGVPRVVRGGSCWFTARLARAAFRVWRFPGGVTRDRGFRVLLPSPRSDS